jgi:hypothetical protein
MDIDYQSVVKTQVNSFLEEPDNLMCVSCPQSTTFKVSNDSPNTLLNAKNEMEEDDWSIEMAQAPTMDLNSKCESNSFHFIQQQYMDQSSFTSMPNSHLDCGNESDCSDNSVTASELSDDELNAPCRRSKALIVDDSEDDMYDEM